MQAKEQKQITEEASREVKNVHRKEALERLSTRLKDMHQSRQEQKDRQSIISQHRKSEAKLVAQGKTPYYLREADVTRLYLAQKYEKLRSQVKSDAALEKVIEKKRKRRASRLRKHMPDQ